MKIYLYLAIVFLFVSACATTSDQTNSEQIIDRYVEKQSPFLDLFKYQFKDNNWIRKPENILLERRNFGMGDKREFKS